MFYTNSHDQYTKWRKLFSDRCKYLNIYNKFHNKRISSWRFSFWTFFFSQSKCVTKIKQTSKMKQNKHIHAFAQATAFIFPLLLEFKHVLCFDVVSNESEKKDRNDCRIWWYRSPFSARFFSKRQILELFSWQIRFVSLLFAFRPTIIERARAYTLTFMHKIFELDVQISLKIPSHIELADFRWIQNANKHKL